MTFVLHFVSNVFIGSYDVKFLFKMLHQMLPTQKQIARTTPNTSHPILECCVKERIHRQTNRQKCNTLTHWHTHITLYIYRYGSCVLFFLIPYHKLSSSYAGNYPTTASSPVHTTHQFLLFTPHIPQHSCCPGYYYH